MKRFALILATVLVQLAVGEDLYWERNSNWNNPSNWALGRPPCSGEIASFASVPVNSVILLNTDATVRSIVLPTNGTIVLGSSVTIRLSEDTECTVPEGTPPMAAPIQNEFTGAVDQWWEAPENWATEDGSAAAGYPCGDDNAIFPQDSAFSFVRANKSVTVRSLTVRGQALQSLQDLQDSTEFQLDIQINPDCGQDPSLCPCPPMATTATTGTPVVEGSKSVAGIVVGVLVALLVVIAVVVVVIILVVYLYMRRRTGSGGFGYAKDDLLDTPADQEGVYKQTNPNVDTKSETRDAFDNPIYDSTVIPSSEVQPIGYETKPSLDGAGYDIPDPVAIGQYEPATEMLKPPEDEDEIKLDLSAAAMEPAEPEPEPEPEPEKDFTPALGKYQRL